MKVVIIAIAVLALFSDAEAKKHRSLKGRHLKGKKGKGKKGKGPVVQVGPRPYFLVESMKPSFLKDHLGKIHTCAVDPVVHVDVAVVVVNYK